MSLRQRATNFALLTIDETPTPPRGGQSTSTVNKSPATTPTIKYPTPLLGNWADYDQDWSPTKRQASDLPNAAGEAPSDGTADSIVESDHMSNEHSVVEETAQPLKFNPPPQPIATTNDPYHFQAFQYPTTPFVAPHGMAPIDSYVQPAPAPNHTYSAPPVYSHYPGYQPNFQTGFQLCTCGCNQLIPCEYTDTVPYTTAPFVESTIPPESTETPERKFVPRFSPPPPPPVKMSTLLNEHGNACGDAVRYHAVLRWVSKIMEDQPYFAPDVSPLPELSTAEDFELTVKRLNEWWKSNFGDRQLQHAAIRSVSRTNIPAQPTQPHTSLQQYISYPAYDRTSVHSRR